MGTPEFAVPSLRALLDAGHEIAAVVTQPDRPAGRGQELRVPPVKQLALSHGIPVLQPEKLRDPAIVEVLRALQPDAIVVAAYGKILPRSLLDVPPSGAINVHASLLPKLRGAAPIQHALLAGEPRTGITIMQMNERMDAGDILLQEAVAILAEDTAGTLERRLAEVGGRALIEGLDRLLRGELTPVPQREEDATLAPMIRKEHGLIDWTRNAHDIERATRAFDPWPGAHTIHRGRLLKIFRARVSELDRTAPPGTVARASGDEIVVATGREALAIVELQLEGKRRLGAREFLAARGAIREGERFG
ncbi:MAG: methionyl-tRNA formyltransferase [Candidatus Binatota bacterium]|nr:methionyl-tRNA formyltransferase [Candidatus Binatota bacterium]